MDSSNESEEKKPVDVRCLINWYIDKTSSIEHGYQGLGSLNIFLYITSGLSFEKFGYQFFHDRILIMEMGPVFEKMLRLFSDQAQCVAKKAEFNGCDYEFTPDELEILENAYRYMCNIKPQRLSGVIKDMDSPWFQHRCDEGSVKYLDPSEVSANVNKILTNYLK